MRNLKLFLLVFLFASCSNVNKQASMAIEDEPEVIVNDTVLFHYVLKTSKETVEKRSKQLIKEKKIKPFETIHVTMRSGFPGVADVKVDVSGHPCTLYLNGESIDAIMSLVFYEDTLLRQEFYLGNNNIYSELSSLYGETALIGDYPTEGKPENISFWKKDGKAIYTAKYFNINYLYFENMDFKIRAKEEIESLKENIEGLIKEENKKKEEQMGW